MGFTTGFVAHDPVLRKPTNRRLMDFPGRNRYQVRSSALPHPGISERRTLTTHVHFAFVLVLDLEFLGGIAGRGVHIEGCILVVYYADISTSSKFQSIPPRFSGEVYVKNPN